MVLNRMRLEVAKAEARLAIGRSDMGDAKMPSYELLMKVLDVLKEGNKCLKSASDMFENQKIVGKDEGDEEQED